jgi:dTDP-glucose 4,6-dehydratase
MKILVTGGAGFIGSNLIRALLKAGHSVLNIDKLTYAGNLESLKDCNSNPSYHLERIDITDADTIDKAVANFSPHSIMHLAAESHVDRSIDGPLQFIQTNIIGTYNLLQSSLRYWKTLPQEDAKRFRFLHVSTDEVYGSLGDTGYFTELTRYDPHSPYSATKASSDHLARAWKDTYGLPILITNCSNNYGPFQYPEKLIPVVILKCLRGETIPVYGKGENIRDWLHVEDHCDALITVLLKGTPGETYNIGGNNELRNIDLVQQLCKILDDLSPNPFGKSYSDQITFVQDRPGHDLRYAIDSSKIKNQLGWSPKHTRETGIHNTAKWYLENQWWWEPILNNKYNLNRLGLN